MRIAAAQAHPIWMDADGTAEKIVGLIRSAAEEGVELLAFPEAFLPGYPFWAILGGLDRLNGSRDAEAYARYLDASVEVAGPHVRLVVEASRELGVFVYLGIAEREGGSIYGTLLAISSDDGIVGAHRKLMPTHGERTMWAIGDGHGLRVHDAGGFRVGGLNCWESWMPQARYAMYAGGEELHVGVFPGSAFAASADLARFVALEGRVWVLFAAGLLSAADVPRDHPYAELIAGKPSGFLNGGSCVVSPAGVWEVAPVVDDERLIVADVDPLSVARARQSFDPAGHSSRPDVFDVRIDRRRLGSRFDDERGYGVAF